MTDLTPITKADLDALQLWLVKRVAVLEPLEKRVMTLEAEVRAMSNRVADLEAETDKRVSILDARVSLITASIGKGDYEAIVKAQEHLAATIAKFQ